MTARRVVVAALMCITLFVVVQLSRPQATPNYYWASPTGSSSAPCASILSTSLDVDPGVYGTIGQAARCATVPGDEAIVKAGTYTNNDDRLLLASTDRNILPGQFVSGTSESVRTKVRGNPNGARPLIRLGGSFYCSYDGASRAYITFQYLEIDNNFVEGCSAGIQINGQHVTIDDIIIYETWTSAIAFNSVSGADTSKSAYGIVRNSIIHDSREMAGAGSSNGYGVYCQSTDVLIENNEIYNTKGWAIHCYTGTSNRPDRAIIRGNYIHDVRVGAVTNNGVTTLFCGGIVAYGTETKVYDNIVNIGSTQCTTHDTNEGAVDFRGVGSIEVYNNTLQTVGGYGVRIGSSSTASALVINNIFGTTDVNATFISGSGSLTSTHNACTSAQSCGSTGKVTLAAIGDCLVNFPTNPRLKTGTNPCRNAGTSVSTRTAPVGVTDLGPYEQGEVASASVVSGFIEMTVNVMSGLLPSAGITGVTITCVGCTGTPVASTVNVRSGSSNVLQVAVTGISSSGTCTISLGITNATDPRVIAGVAQGLNTASGVSVSGTCVNTGSASPGSGLWSHFPLNEGSGTVANDDSGAAHHGTVSAGVTWVNDSSGSGVTIPSDATYRQISSTYGSGVNPTTQDFTVCVYAKVDTTETQKVLFSSSANGGNQRWYAGFYTLSGQRQWGIGVQGSGFSTGSEFVVTSDKTLICMVTDATADTVALSVNGVMGTLSGKSLKTTTSYTLVGNIIAGNDGTFTTNNGGTTIYEMWVWNNKQSASDLLTLYQSLTPTGSATPCLAQTHRQFEAVYTTAGGSPIVLTPKPDGSIDVVKNGGVAVRIQYTCTGAAGVAVALQAFYSNDNVSFDLPVPAALGAAGIAMWGEDLDAYFNDGASTGCLDATGLTANSGITVLGATAGPTFTLAQNHCRSDRYIFRFGTIEGPVWVQMKTDSGRTFANGYTQAIKFNVIPSQANMGL